jgi:O-antigen/teichoic acid export membrane protein
LVRKLLGPAGINFVAAFARLTLSILIARTLGVEGRGEIAVFVSLAEISSRFLSFGMPVALGARVKETMPPVGRVCTYMLILWLLFAIPIATLISTFSADIYSISFAFALAILVVSFCGRTLLRNVLAGAGKLVPAASILAGSMLLTLLLALIIVSLGHFSVYLAVFSYCFGGISGVVLGCLFVNRGSIPHSIWPPAAPTRSDWIFGVRSVPFSVCQHYNNVGDVVIIGIVAGFEVAGYYVIALNVVRPLLVLANTMGLIGFSEGANRGVKRITGWLLARALSVSILWMPVAWFGIQELFGEEYVVAQSTAMVLCISSGVRMVYGYLAQSNLASGNVFGPSIAELLAATVTTLGLFGFAVFLGLQPVHAAIVSLLAYSAKLIYVDRTSLQSVDLAK